MQKNFLLKAKKSIKKVAVLGVGSLMLGLTAGGALAQADLDLENYPAPFINNGNYDNSNAFVVGASAAASDTLGAIDIAVNLQFEARECSPFTTSGGSIINLVGGKSEDIPIESNIVATNQIDPELDASDLNGFLDESVNFQNTDYDISEVLEFSRKANVSVHSGLTASDDDYEDNVVLEIERNSIRYYYVFDESIDLKEATTENPLEITFLGKVMKITEVDSGSGVKFTAQIGTGYFMDIDDVVTVDGRRITLKNVGSSGAVVVDVNGVQETLSRGATKTINGIEVNNDESFYTDQKDERSATLIIGQDIKESYSDEDSYIGESDSNPKWVWDIGNLNQVGITSITNDNSGISINGPYLGVVNERRYVDGSDEDPLFIGDCIDLPNNYASICLDSLTVHEDNYLGLEIKIDQGIDFSNVIPEYSSENVIRIKSSEKETLKLKDGSLDMDNLSRDYLTDEVWIVGNETNFSVFYRDVETHKKLFAGRDAMLINGTSANNFIEVNFRDTKDSNVAFDIGFTNGIMELTLDVQGDSNLDLADGMDDITMKFGDGTYSSGFLSLGSQMSAEESGELTALGNPGRTIGTKDENQRTKYGIVIEDPKSNGANDEVQFKIPGDQVQANVLIRGPGQIKSTSGNITTGEVCNPLEVDMKSFLDTEVSSPDDYNLIVVGGPAINYLAEKFIGTAEEFRETYEAGEAVIKLVENGERVAMVVAGYNAMDTRRGSKVIANYKDYSLSGSEALVRGTTLTDMTVD